MRAQDAHKHSRFTQLSRSPQLPLSQIQRYRLHLMRQQDNPENLVPAVNHEDRISDLGVAPEATHTIEDRPAIELHSCKICFEAGTASETDYPGDLVTPCSCRGSMAFIHTACLVQVRKKARNPLKEEVSYYFVLNSFDKSDSACADNHESAQRHFVFVMGVHL